MAGFRTKQHSNASALLPLASFVALGRRNAITIALSAPNAMSSVQFVFTKIRLLLSRTWICTFALLIRSVNLHSVLQVTFCND
jgi:hypothetical protein